MCGLFDNQKTSSGQGYLSAIGVRDFSGMITGQRIRPTQQISIVTTRHGEPRLETANWHLYLTRQGNRFVPDKRYWSINTNWRNLDKKEEYRTQRCLIPATAWVESQEGEDPVQFDYGPESAFMFCGLYRIYAGNVLGASIITLPAHSLTQMFHAKSLPWIAERTRSFAHQWLTSRDTSQFSTDPRLYRGRPLTVQPLHRAMDPTPAGPRQEL